MKSCPLPASSSPVTVYFPEASVVDEYRPLMRTTAPAIGAAVAASVTCPVSSMAMGAGLDAGDGVEGSRTGVGTVGVPPPQPPMKIDNTIQVDAFSMFRPTYITAVDQNRGNQQSSQASYVSQQFLPGLILDAREGDGMEINGPDGGTQDR